MIEISIIIPVYNVAQYVVRCLESVANQTYKGKIECILIDDCGNDNSAEICDDYIKRYKGNIDFKLIRKEKNGGLSEARNTGTKITRGDFVYYLDSDDELPEDAIESMFSVLKEHPDVEIIVGKMQDIPDKKMYFNPRFDDIKFINDNNWIRKNFCRLKNRIPVNACNKLIRKSFLIDNNLFFKEGLIHEDELWMFQVSQKLKKIAFINKITYLRYINPGSITTATPSQQKKHAWGIIFLEIFSSIDTPAFFEQFVTYYQHLQTFNPFEKDNNKALYKTVWQELIKCAKRNGHPIIAASLKLHSALYPLLKGHGTGFCIWLIQTKLHHKEYKSILD